MERVIRIRSGDALWIRVVNGDGASKRPLPKLAVDALRRLITGGFSCNTPRIVFATGAYNLVGMRNLALDAQ